MESLRDRRGRESRERGREIGWKKVPNVTGIISLCLDCYINNVDLYLLVTVLIYSVASRFSLLLLH